MITVFMFIPLLVIAATLVAAVGSLIWVFQYANRRGRSGGFWVLGLLFTNIFGGLFIYLALRNRFPPQDPY